MDPTLLAALIGGVFAIVASLIPIYLNRRRKKYEYFDLPEFEHFEGLSVAVGVVQKEKDILMVRRKKRYGRLSWQFPAGIVKPGQDPIDRAVEEVRKETGVTCKVLKSLGQRVHSDSKVLCLYMHCMYLDGDARNLDTDENEEVRWVQVTKVPSYVTSSLYSGVGQLFEKIKRGEA